MRLLVSFLLATAFLAVGVPPQAAEAFEIPTATWAATSTTGTVATPSGVTITVTGTGNTDNNGTATAGARGWDASQYSPTLVTGDSVTSPLVNTGSCASTGTCPNLGTLTIGFSQPVRNPVLHISGMGGSYGSTTSRSDIHAVLDLATSGLSLTRLAGNTQFSVTSTRITAANHSASPSCTTTLISTGANAAATAACGSVRVNGTVTSLVFNMSAVLVQNPNASSPNNASGSGDAFGLTVTLPQDFGDAPTTYNPSQAPAHVIGDLRLGSILPDEDNPATRNATASPFAGTSANGDDTNGTDDEDAFGSSPPNVLAGVANTYTVTVPVSGVSKTAYVCGYIDFNKGGTFDTSTERACATVATGATSAELSWSVPASTTAGTTFARFRVGYTQSQVQSPTGLANSGEVEDYTIVFAGRPTIVLNKITLGAAGGPFGFTLTNTTQATGTVTTTAAGTATQVDGDTGSGTQPFTVAAVNTAVTINETTIPSAWALSSATCTNAAGTTIGSLSGSTYTLPANEMVPGAAITCTYRNGRPSISLTKAAGSISTGANGPFAGDTVPYTFTVTNTGQTPLSSIAVTDAKVGTVTCAATTLAIGASTTCTASYPLTQADINAGQVVNNATVSGTPPTGSAVTGTATDTKNLPQNPAIDLTKTAGQVTDTDGNGHDVGDTITYTFVVRNTGNVSLTGVGINDPAVGPVTCPATTLAPGASTTCTRSYTLTQADVNAGVVNNTATASGTPPTGTAVTDTDSASRAINRSATISIVKQAGTPSGTTAGSTIGYTFAVTNTGNTTLTSVQVSDPKVGSVSCPATTLAPGASTTCTATYAITQADVNAGQVVNTATATGTPPAGLTPPTADGTVTTVLPRTPAISLDKQTAGITDLDGNGPDAGDRLNYTFLVTNAGNVTLNPVSVSDPMVAVVTCPLTSLAPGASTTCTGSYTLTQSDFDTGSVNNTATASGVGPAGTGTVTATDSNATPLTAGPALSLDKQAGTPSGNTVGSTLGYTFVVTNTGNVTMNGISLADSKVSSVSCPQSSLAPGASMTCSATYTLVSSDVDAGAVVNSATVTGYAASNGQAASATDGTTTPIVRNPSITLDKQVGTPAGATAGATVPYTFVVVNTGNVTLTSVQITDGKITSVSCPATTLAAGASITCTGSYTLTQTDIDAGHIANNATASGTPPAGPAVTAADATDLTLSRTAAITLDKQAGVPSGSAAGETIAYSFLVTNTGNTTLTSVAVSDPKVGTVTCPVTTLLPGASTTCVATYPITQADLDAGVVDNTASVTGTPPAGLSRPTATDSTTSPLTRTPGISVDKQAGTPSGATAGSTIAYTFVVTNTGNVTLTGVGVSDPKVGTVNCPATTLAPGASTTCTATYSLTQADVDGGTVVNTATASGTPPPGLTRPTGTDSTTTTIAPDPKLTLTKSAAAPSSNNAGATIAYTFLVRNTGNVTLHAVAVTDPLVASVTCPVTTLAPGASTTCTGTHTVTQAEMDAGSVVNTASASGTPPTGESVTATGGTTTPLTRTPAITLDKQAGTPSGNTVGSTIAYTFIVRNTGNVTLTSVQVADPKVGEPTCPQTTLAPGATTTCTLTYLLTQADIDAGHVANTATATGTPPTGLTAPRATDSTDTSVAQNPLLTLDKQAGTPSGTTAGSTIAYTFLLTNSGNVTLTSVQVTDPKVGAVGCPVDELAPGESTTCAATYTLTQGDVDAGHVANTATATGDGPSGNSATATDATDTPVPAGPAISLDKQAGAPSGNVPGATIAYTFVVTNTGNVTLSGIALSDPKLGPLTCPATSIAPGGSTTCTGSYTLTQPDIDAGAVVNVATVAGTSPGGVSVTSTDTTDTPIGAEPALTLDKQAGTPSGNTAGSTIAYTFLVANTGNVTLTSLTVDDPQAAPVTCAVTTLAPGASTTCTGTHTITQAEVDGGHVVNDATASGTTTGGATPTATDSTDTPIAPAPAITVDKRAGTASGNTAGSTVAYSFVVTNAGNVTLTTVGVTDPKVGAVSCPDTTLAPGAATTCTATYTLTQADVDAGQVVNTATASGTPPTGEPVTGTDTETSPVVRTASLSLAKTAGTPSGNTAGSTIAYTFVVTNTGNTTLTGVNVADPQVSSVSCPDTTLAPGASTTCTGTHTITQAEVDAGTVENTATARANPPAGVTPPSATDHATAPLERTPAIALDKESGGIIDLDDNGPDAGDTVAFTFLVQNTGNVTLNAVTVTDPKVGAVSCPATTLAPGTTTSCAATYTLTQADVDSGQLANTATATGTPPAGLDAPTATDSVVIGIEAGARLSLDKQAGTPSGAIAGSTMPFTFVVTNTGNVTLSAITVIDPLAGPVPCPTEPLAPGASATCSATYTLTQGDVDAGVVTNTATASGTPPAGEPVSASDSTSTDIPRSAAISLDKEAGTPSGNAAGDTIAYSFVVTNEGTTTLVGVHVTDPKVGAVSCPDATLAPGASTICTATYVLTQADVDAGHVANTAGATGTPPAGLMPPTASDSTDTPVTPAPAISLDKQAGTPSGNTAGSTIAYSFVVTNTGTVTLSSVTVDDSRVSAVACPVDTLVPGQSTTCTATYSLTQADVDAGHVANNASVQGTSPSGTDVDAADTTDTPIGSSPAITLDKQGGTPSANANGATVPYTFVVTNTGNVTLSAVAVNDPKVGAVSCPDTSLAPGASTICTATYTLGQADVDAGVVNNTATAAGTSPSGTRVTASDSVSTPIPSAPSVTMDKQAGTPTTNAAGGTITYTFGVENTGNVTLTLLSVIDVRTGAVSCPVTTLLPGESTICEATYTLVQADVDAGHVANTAIVTATTPSGGRTTGSDSTDTAIPAGPAISLDKQAAAPSGNTAGSTIRYTFVVTNTGNVTLSAVGINDPLVGAVSCPVSTVAPGASTTCSATYTLSQADVDAGVVNNSATASGTPPTGEAVTSTDVTSSPITAAPRLVLDKQAGTLSGHTTGSTIDFTFRVVNTGNVTLSAVGIEDAKVGTVSCPVATLAPGAETTCTATYTLDQADVDAGHVANTATASGTPPTGGPVTVDDSTDTPVIADPMLTLDKQAGTPSGNSAGDTIAYTFVVTNHGNVTLTAIGVDDPKVGAVTCPDDTLVPGASTTCSATYILTQPDVDAGVVDNSATASGTPPTGDAVNASDSTSTPIAEAPALTLDKQAGVPSGNMAGSTIAYAFVVTNTGNVTLHAVAVSDPKVGAVSCPDTTLAPGLSTTCTATYTLTQGDVDAGHVANTATAWGTPPASGPVSATDNTDVPIVTGPVIDIDKEAGAPSGNAAGDTIAYTFLVTNRGNVTLHSVGVSDPKVGVVSCPDATLAPGASTTCTATYTLGQDDVDAGVVDNTATASGTPPTGGAVTADDTVSTPIPAAPAITVDKQAGIPSGNSAGDTIAYTFVVTNTGNVTLTSVGVDDPKVGAVSCPAVTLAPGASTTCTATYALGQADVDAGHVANTATVSGTPPIGDDVTGSDVTDTPILAGPAISLDKQAGTPSGNAAGSTIAYTFVVVNTGNVTLTSVGVDDPKVGAVSCPDATLAPGASTTCTATYTLGQDDVDAGVVDNTATASGTPPTGAAVNGADSTSTPIPSAPAITVDKQAGIPSGSAAGDTIAYTFVVVNTGNVTLTSVGVDDPKVGAVSCPDATLAPGASTTCTATYTLGQGDVDAGHVANTATAMGTPPTGGTVTGGDSTDTTIPAGPAITLDKQAGAPSGNSAGSTIAYTFVVTNTGNVTLTAVGVFDPKVGAVSCPDATLAPGASTTCTATYTLGQDDVDAGVVDNTATASGTPPTGAAVTESDTVSTPIPAAPAITVDKQAGIPSGNSAGDTIAYSFVVTNTGNVTLTAVGVFDPKVGAVSCPDATLAPGASTTCSATYTLGQADVDAGHVANTATASGTPPTGDPVRGGDSTDTPIPAGPAITVDKQAGTPSGNSAGDTIVYSFVVTNTGNVTLTSVGVADPKVGAVSCPDATLAPGASTTCSATYTLDQDDVDAGVVDNTATASGTPPTGGPVTGSDTVSTPIPAAPAITVDKQAGIPSGNEVGDTIAYTFVVTNTGNVTLTSVGVDDPRVGAVSCPDATLAPGASTTCTATYTLGQGDVDAGHVANTATVSGTPPTGGPVTGGDSTDTTIPAGPAISLDKQAGTPSGNTAGSTIVYSFVVVNTGNVTLTAVGVDDPKVGAVSCPDATLAPGASTTCSATYTLDQADVDAGVVDNTATAAGTDPSGTTVTAGDSTHTTIASLPQVDLLKQAGTPSGNTAGSTIGYTFEVTNLGNVTLDPVSVADPKVGAVACPATVLAPSASTVCTATYTLTQADVDAGAVDNTATAFGNPPGGDPSSPADDTTDTSSVSTPIPASPGIDLVKTGTADGNHVGDHVDYTFVVTNTGNVTLDPVSVADPMVGAVTCPDTRLAPGDAVTCTATYTLDEDDVDAGVVHNEATASGRAPSGAVVTAAAEVDVPIVHGPSLSLDKQAGTPSGSGVGATIAYTFVVTNTGNVTLHDVSVSDPKVGAVSCPGAVLAAGRSMTCTATYTVTQADVDAGMVVNGATASGRPRSGTGVTGSDTVTTPLAQLPAISLVKSADVTAELAAGDQVNYTFVVTNTGNVTLSGISVSDPMLTGVTCPAATLAPAESMTCTADPYTVTTQDVARGRISNQATVTGSFCPEAGCQVVSAADTVLVTTAVVEDDDGDDGDDDGDLAYTGFTGTRTLLLGGGVLAAGLALLIVGRRRRV